MGQNKNMSYPTYGKRIKANLQEKFLGCHSSHLTLNVDIIQEYFTRIIILYQLLKI